ncbi:MAG TPA: DUF885 domain-containing protein [Candidatus Limnocylindria bacterium]|nr:DUF885 domain-containing protein [Candidatus Limnocylindria bacterium]
MPVFSDLARQFLDEEHAANPVRASYLGLTDYDDQLDDLSASAIEADAARSAAWLDRFAALDDDELTFDERIDRDVAVAALRERAIYHAWEIWRRQPDLYLNPGMRGVFVLFLHQLRPEDELAAAAAARLRQVPATLDAGRANLRPELVPLVILERAINQARAGARYVRDLLPADVAEEHRADLAAAGGAAADAFEAYAGFLEEMRPAATGDWAFGEANYTAILRDAELLAPDTRALHQRGREQVDLLLGEMRRLSTEIAGHDDWKRLIDELNQDRPADPEAMRVGYEDWTERARQFLHDRRLVTFPAGEDCLVVPSPPFQRPVIAVASYVAPPHYAETFRGHFFVPYPPDGASEEEIGKRLESNSYPGIPTTAVHEAYPGHHWHLAMAKTNPSPMRAEFGTSYFAEGWALYAEQMMTDNGFYEDPRHVFYQVEARLFRAARIVVDTALHMGEMTHDEAVAFMLAHSSLTEPTAIAEVTRYCSWPTQASSYLTGALEIARIRDAFFAARGAAAGDTDTLRDFHDAIAGAGTLPIALAERAALARA